MFCVKNKYGRTNKNEVVLNKLMKKHIPTYDVLCLLVLNLIHVNLSLIVLLFLLKNSVYIFFFYSQGRKIQTNYMMGGGGN